MYSEVNGFLVWSVVGYCGCGVCGDCNGVSAGIWVIHSCPKSGCNLVTLFDSFSYDGVSAGVWVIHTEVPNMGARWSRFLAVTLMMV